MSGGELRGEGGAYYGSSSDQVVGDRRELDSARYDRSGSHHSHSELRGEGMASRRVGGYESEGVGLTESRQESEVCGRKFFSEVEDCPVVKERVERYVEHHPVEKEYVVEMRAVGETEVAAGGEREVEGGGEQSCQGSAGATKRGASALLEWHVSCELELG
jgi:hypothetical protein